MPSAGILLSFAGYQGEVLSESTSSNVYLHGQGTFANSTAIRHQQVTLGAVSFDLKECVSYVRIMYVCLYV